MSCGASPRARSASASAGDRYPRLFGDIVTRRRRGRAAAFGAPSFHIRRDIPIAISSIGSRPRADPGWAGRKSADRGLAHSSKTHGSGRAEANDARNELRVGNATGPDERSTMIGRRFAWPPRRLRRRPLRGAGARRRRRAADGRDRDARRARRSARLRTTCPMSIPRRPREAASTSPTSAPSTA